MTILYDKAYKAISDVFSGRDRSLEETLDDLELLLSDVFSGRDRSLEETLDDLELLLDDIESFIVSIEEDIERECLEEDQVEE